MKKTILILADTDLKRDGRIRKHILALKDKYKIIVTGLCNPDIKGNIEFINCSKENISKEEWQKRSNRLHKNLSEKNYYNVYWQEDYINKLYNRLIKRDFDAILANDIMMVPLGVVLAKEKKIKIIADMHEYSPKELEESRQWCERYQKLNDYLCREYLTKCNYVTTVSEGIKKEYLREYNVESSIITNAPFYSEFEAKPVDGKIKLVHHGGCSKYRNLEELIKLDKYLDERFTIDIYLVGSKEDEYYKYLKSLILKSKRCFLREIVKPEEIVNMLRSYDIGVHLLKPTNLNHVYALPNKFFEFVQARLAVAMGQLPEMKKYIDKYKCGITCKEYTAEALAAELNKLTIEQINELKINSEKLAADENFNKNSYRLNTIVEKLFKEG